WLPAMYCAVLSLLFFLVCPPATAPIYTLALHDALPIWPDGKPLIGATPYRNLWLNTGHGGLGFTLALGSARVLADLMRGRDPARSEEHTSELQSRENLVCRLLLEKKKTP